MRTHHRRSGGRVRTGEHLELIDKRVVSAVAALVWVHLGSHGRPGQRIPTSPFGRALVIACAVTLVACSGFPAVEGSGADSASPSPGEQASAPSETIEVTRQDITTERRLSARTVPLFTEAVLSGADGVVTRPAVQGSEVPPGQPIAHVNETPLRLLPGAVPMFRPLQFPAPEVESPTSTAPDAMSRTSPNAAMLLEGADVRQLEDFLFAAGFGTGEVDGRFDQDLAQATRQWRRRLGEANPPAGLALGDIAFVALGGPWRVAEATASRGQYVAAGEALATLTSGAEAVEIVTETEPAENISYALEDGTALNVLRSTPTADAATQFTVLLETQEPVEVAADATVIERTLVRPSSIAVPALAIRQDGRGEPYVLCRPNDTQEFRQCRVTLDADPVGVDVVVLTGLSEGDQVALS